jgi:hypothetical protein
MALVRLTWPFHACISGTIPTELGRMTILENLSLESNTLTGAAPDEICQLRNLELSLFVTDCYSNSTHRGVVCEVDKVVNGRKVEKCCTFCRRKN